MKIIKGYVFKLKPNKAQEAAFWNWAGSTRFVWNQALALQKRAREEGQEPIFCNEMCSFLTHWKRDPYPWLYESPNAILQQSLRDLDAAWKKCVKEGAGAPRFKARGKARNSFRFPENFRFEGNKVRIPKLGWVKFFTGRRGFVGTPKNLTVFERAGRWYMSVCCEREVPEPVHPSKSAVGIDLGVAKFATLSDGSVVDSIKFDRLQKLLARAQKNLARCQKGSNRRKKAVLRVARVQERIANVRKGFLHKVSTQIADAHGLVVLENLKVSNMTSSAKGTVDCPGTNVAAKSGLNRSLLEQGFYSFRQMLEYKEFERGGKVELVNPAYTSQKCSVCGFTAKENRKTQASFCCQQCGFAENADLNAAKNILAAAV